MSDRDNDPHNARSYTERTVVTERPVNATEARSGSGSLLWIILALLVAAALAWWLLGRGADNTVATEPAVTTTEPVTTTAPATPGGAVTTTEPVTTTTPATTTVDPAATTTTTVPVTPAAPAGAATTPATN